MQQSEPLSKEIQILVAARELMFRYGIKSLTMDDISQHLGISKKTLYQVVANKAELVDKVMEMTVSERKAGVGCLQQEADNAIDEMLKIYQEHSILIKRMNLALIFELKKYFPESWNKLEAFRNEFVFETVCNNIDKGKQTGLYRLDLNTLVVAKLYASRVLDLINPELFPREEFPADLLLQEMFMYHIHGIASAKGIAYLQHHVKPTF